jgi:hypothetical protein
MADRKSQRTKPRGAQPQRPARRPATQPRRVMPVWLQNTLAGLIIFTLMLGMGLLPQLIVCALGLGVAVYQLWYRRARWLWTWASFLAVGLFVLGMYLTPLYQPLWFLYFGAWIFVIVALVGEGSRAIRRPRGAADGPDHA